MWGTVVLFFLGEDDSLLQKKPLLRQGWSSADFALPSSLPSLLLAPSKAWVWAGSRGLAGGLCWARWWSALSQSLAWLWLHLVLSSWEMSLMAAENPRHRSCRAFSTELERGDVGWRVSLGGWWRVWDGRRGGEEGNAGRQLRNEHEGGDRGSPGSMKGKPRSWNGK